MSAYGIVETLGEMAYRSYAMEAGWRTYDGQEMLPWAELPSDVKRAWQRAGEAAGAMAVRKAFDRVLAVACGEKA